MLAKDRNRLPLKQVRPKLDNTTDHLIADRKTNVELVVQLLQVRLVIDVFENNAGAKQIIPVRSGLGPRENLLERILLVRDRISNSRLNLRQQLASGRIRVHLLTQREITIERSGARITFVNRRPDDHVLVAGVLVQT